MPVKQLIEFYPITDRPGLHGIWGRRGNRIVEILETEPDTWFCFATIDDFICMRVAADTTLSVAKQWARQFLTGKITPELWPTKEFILHDLPKRKRA